MGRGEISFPIIKFVVLVENLCRIDERRSGLCSIFTRNDNMSSFIVVASKGIGGQYLSLLLLFLEKKWS